MSGIDRPDWQPAEAPAVEAKERSITRPDWDGAPQPAVPAEKRDGIVVRPDWTASPEADLSMEPHDGEPHDADDGFKDAVTLENRQQTPPDAMSPVEMAIEEIPAENRQDFMDSFDELGAGVTEAVSDALSVQTSQPTDAAGLDNFSQTDEGAELAQEWGHEAQQKIGLIQSRLMQIEAEAAPGEVEAMWSWYDDLPTDEARAVLLALSQ